MNTAAPFDVLTAPVSIAEIASLEEKQPTHAKVLRTELVVIRYGRCLHRLTGISYAGIHSDFR